jgi:hypothetical protein
MSEEGKNHELVRRTESDLATRSERQLQEYHVEQTHREIASIRETVDSAVSRKDYTTSNSAGPRELTAELSSDAQDALDESNQFLGGLVQIGVANNSQLDAIRESSDVNARANVKTHNQVVLVRKGTDELPEIRRIVSNLTAVGAANLGATAIGAYEAGRTADAVVELSERIEGCLDDIAYGVEEVHGAVEVVSDQVEDLTREVGKGFRATIDVLGDVHADMKREGEATRSTIIDCTVALGTALDLGFSGISSQMEGLRGDHQKYALALIQSLEAFNIQHQRSHAELKAEVTRVAENKNALNANERYSFALNHFEVGNIIGATAELDQVFEAQSTHLPGLLLLARIAASKAEWANAKDTYYLASKLAVVAKDPLAYDTAIIGLARVEKTVGNDSRAEELLSTGSLEWVKAVKSRRGPKPVNLSFESTKRIAKEAGDSIDVKAIIDNLPDECDVEDCAELKSLLIGFKTSCHWIAIQFEKSLRAKTKCTNEERQDFKRRAAKLRRGFSMQRELLKRLHQNGADAEISTVKCRIEDLIRFQGKVHKLVWDLDGNANHTFRLTLQVFNEMAHLASEAGIGPPEPDRSI